MIRCRKNPKTEIYLQGHYKSLTAEVFFDVEKYRSIYPETNQYPLKGLLKPIKDHIEFSDFMFSMLIEGLGKIDDQLRPTWTKPLINVAQEFKSDGYINRWLHGRYNIKEANLKAYLYCSLNCNFFSLQLALERGKKLIFNQEILKTLPSSIQYKDEFKKVELHDNKVVVTREYPEGNLFSLNLNDIIIK